MLRLVLVLAVLTLTAPASGLAQSGSLRVLDGDTIEIGRERIRFHGVDAAEGRQRCARAGGGTWDCASAATNRLRQLMRAGPVECQRLGTDRWGRTIGRCFAGGLDVQEVLVREGLAWAYHHFSRDYAAAERAAQREGRGIWQAPTMPPWDWRRTRR